MSSYPQRPAAVFTRERLSTIVLGVATILALYFSASLLAPFLAPLTFAVALAIAADQPYRKLRVRLHSRAMSAGVATLLVALLIVIPVALLGTYSVHRSMEALDAWRGKDWEAIVASSPTLSRAWMWAEQRIDIAAQAESLAKASSQYAGNFLTGVASVVTQLMIALFVLFFLFRDRELAVNSIRRLVPLTDGETGQLFCSVVDTVRATVNGSLTVGLVQAVLAGIMYQILGVTGAVVWAAVTFVAALVPMLGTALVWGPIAIYLLAIGSWLKAAILVGWGMVAIGLIDNLLYPFLVGTKMRMHTVPTFFAILGGIAVFGTAGLILGPVILACSVELLDIWWSRTADGSAAEEDVPETSSEPPIRREG